MKFTEKYPQAKLWDEPEPSLKKVRTTVRCCECGEQTDWLDIDFNVRVCSEECLNKLVNDFLEFESK